MAREPDWAERIGRHITVEGSVIVPPRIANWLAEFSQRDVIVPIFGTRAPKSTALCHNPLGVGEYPTCGYAKARLA